MFTRISTKTSTRTFHHFLVECLIFLLLFDLVACGSIGSAGEPSRPKFLVEERVFKFLNLLSPDLSGELSKESRVDSLSFAGKAVPVRVASDGAVKSDETAESGGVVELGRASVAESSTQSAALNRPSSIVKSTNALNNGQSNGNEANSPEDRQTSGREPDKGAWYKLDRTDKQSDRSQSDSSQSDRSIELSRPALSANEWNIITERSLIKNHLFVRLGSLKEACKELNASLNAAAPFDKFDKLGSVLINFLKPRTGKLASVRLNEGATNSLNLLRTKLIRCVGRTNFGKLKRFLVSQGQLSKTVSLREESRLDEVSLADQVSLKNDDDNDLYSVQPAQSNRNFRDKRQIKNSISTVGQNSTNPPTHHPTDQSANHPSHHHNDHLRNSSSTNFFTSIVNKFLDLKTKKSKGTADKNTSEIQLYSQANVHLNAVGPTGNHRNDPNRRLVHKLQQLNNRQILSQVLEKDGNITQLLLKNNLTEDDLLNRTNSFLTSLFLQIKDYKDLDVENFKPSNSCRNYVRNALYFLCDGESFTEVPQLDAAVETL